jgi:hypothetical protein
MKTTTRLAMLLTVALGCGAGELQPATPDTTACLVIDGQRIARVTGGPDGWCDYDGETCACHGHGVGDECEQAVAYFDESCR